MSSASAASAIHARDAARAIVERHGTSDCSCLRDEFPCEKCHMAIEDIVAALSRPAPEDDAGRGTRYVVEHQPDLERGCDWLVVDMQPPGYPGERHVVAKCYRESVARRIALILAREFAGPEGSATPPLLAAPSGTASITPSPPFMLPDPVPATEPIDAGREIIVCPKNVAPSDDDRGRDDRRG